MENILLGLFFIIGLASVSKGILFLYLNKNFDNYLFLKALSCTEEPVCLTFPKEAVQVYCSSFLKVPCPVSCGKCACKYFIFIFCYYLLKAFILLQRISLK